MFKFMQWHRKFMTCPCSMTTILSKIIINIYITQIFRVYIIWVQKCYISLYLFSPLYHFRSSNNDHDYATDLNCNVRLGSQQRTSSLLHFSTWYLDVHVYCICVYCHHSFCSCLLSAKIWAQEKSLGCWNCWGSFYPFVIYSL